MKTLLTCGSILYFTLTLPVSAATFTADFNSGTVPAGSTISGTAAANAAGGYTNSGGLRLTEAVGGQVGNWVVNDFSAGAAINAFNATFKVELGPVGGADGFSLNWGTNATGSG